MPTTVSETYSELQIQVELLSFSRLEEAYEKKENRVRIDNLDFLIEARDKLFLFFAPVAISLLVLIHHLHDLDPHMLFHLPHHPPMRSLGDCCAVWPIALLIAVNATLNDIDGCQ